MRHNRISSTWQMAKPVSAGTRLLTARRTSGHPGAALALMAALVVLAVPAQAITTGTTTSAFAAVGPTLGVQVTPDWVVTAFHVSAALQPGFTFTNGYGIRTVAALYAAPGSGVFPANDLALVRLAPALSPTPYLQVSSDLFPEGLFSPVPVTIVSGSFLYAPLRGYAFTAVNEFRTMIDADDAGPLLPVVANYLISNDRLVYAEGGDSGGALFLGHVTDSTSALLGVTSVRFDDANNVPFGSGFVALAAYRSWIDGTMAADLADSQMLSWVSAVPEPGSLLLWALGLTLLAGAVRRRTA